MQSWFAGSDQKVEYMKSIGFDAANNYKTVESLDAAIKESCPNGVDMFSLIMPPSIIFDGAEAAQAGRVYCHTLVQWLASCLQRDVSVDSRGQAPVQGACD